MTWSGTGDAPDGAGAPQVVAVTLGEWVDRWCGGERRT